jgi:hypothetical protein
MAIRPVQTKAIGTPWSGSGTSARASLSRMPLISSMASVKPSPLAMPFQEASARPPPMLPGWISGGYGAFSRATPITAQFVVISGRKMPNASYRAGSRERMNSSTSCTSAAMTRMNIGV